MGERSVFMCIDVSAEASFKRLLDATERKFGTLDIMVNNAGTGVAGNVAEQTEDEWDRIMNVNAKGAFFGCKHAVHRMLPCNRGCIINIASVAGMVGVSNRAGYSASKAAIVGLTKSVAVDYAEHGIRVNSILPSTVDSPWVQKILADNPWPKEAHKQMEQRQPIGRMGTSEEIASLAVYLASDDSEVRFAADIAQQLLR